ncbi:MAG: hypothetical protein CMJ42_23230 [Phyllobacteriaceae bacterium]|nr:hypothetical protein [Phyllobacteriaceae bacterium]MBA93271.1 hypothetical protein [Phyllobacteriaceae bacterium]
MFNFVHRVGLRHPSMIILISRVNSCFSMKLSPRVPFIHGLRSLALISLPVVDEDQFTILTES